MADCALRSWLLGSIGDDVLTLVDEPYATANELFTTISDLFTENKESRAIFLSNEFHTLIQGDMSINDYGQKVKTIANSLRDVGHAISESQLVLNLLRGLNPRFSSTADNIANTVPFPNFRLACNMLSLKEQHLASEAQVASQTALIATTPPPQCGPGGCRSSNPSTPLPEHTRAHAPSFGGGRGRHRGRGRGGDPSWHAPPGGYPNWCPNSAPMGPWICYNPWATQGSYGQPRLPSQGLLGPPPAGQHGLHACLGRKIMITRVDFSNIAAGENKYATVPVY